MAIDIGSLLSKISNLSFGLPLINMLSNTAFTAVFLSISMILIIMFMYPAKSGTSMHVLFKMFVYMFLIGLCIVFLHDGVLKYEKNTEQNINVQDTLVKNVATGGDIQYTNKLPVQPNPANLPVWNSQNTNQQMQPINQTGGYPQFQTPQTTFINKEPLYTTNIIEGGSSIGDLNAPKSNITSRKLFV